MKEKEKAEWKLFSENDSNFRNVENREREKRKWNDPPRLSYPELEEARKILDTDQDEKRLEEAGVILTRPKTSKIVKRSQERADRAILSEGESNWPGAEKMTHLEPLNEAKLVPRRVSRAKKVRAVEDSRTDEAILSEGEKNWTAAAQIGKDKYATPTIEEARNYIELNSWTEERIQKIEEEVQVMFTDALSAKEAGDENLYWEIIEDTENLQLEKLELQGAFSD